MVKVKRIRGEIINGLHRDCPTLQICVKLLRILVVLDLNMSKRHTVPAISYHHAVVVILIKREHVGIKLDLVKKSLGSLDMPP
jgi:hypothetical protein